MTIVISPASVSAQFTFSACATASWSNFWTLFWNPFFAVFAADVNTPTACANVVSWANYVSKYYGIGGSGFNANCVGKAGAFPNGTCTLGRVCVARPVGASFKCS